MAAVRRSKMGRSVRRALPILVILSALIPVALPGGASASPPPQPIANTPFDRVWQYADWPVSVGKAQRSWLWGPQANATMMEPLVESPGGKRQVQYYDKSRMEINDPNADPNSPWYVTNGLLVVEMISGRVQTGFNTFEQRVPAQVQVAGDPPITMNAARLTPNYADLAHVATLHTGQNEAQPRSGQEVRETLNADGTVRQGAPNINVPVPKYMYYELVTHHNVADVFMSFMNQSGVVYQNGQFVQGQKLFNWIYAMGYPITEPYWITVQIKGQNYPILMQAFQRRLLTYNPANAPEWRVEMGNVGMQYYQWRYNSTPPAPTPGPRPGAAMQVRRFDGFGLSDPRSFSGIQQELYTVVTTQADWTALWNKHFAAMDRVPPPPAVSFGKEVVLGAFWGTKPDSCYRLTISDVRLKDTTITVYVDETQKAGACLTVLTQPHDIVALSTAGLTAGTYKVVFLANDKTPLATKDVKLP